MSTDDTVSVTEAAQMLGVPRQKVHYAIKTGRIAAVPQKRSVLDRRTPNIRISRQVIEQLLVQQSQLQAS